MKLIRIVAYSYITSTGKMTWYFCTCHSWLKLIGKVYFTSCLVNSNSWWSSAPLIWSYLAVLFCITCWLPGTAYTYSCAACSWLLLSCTTVGSRKSTKIRSLWEEYRTETSFTCKLLLSLLSQSDSTRLIFSSLSVRLLGYYSLLSLSQTLPGYYSLLSLSHTLLGYYSLLSQSDSTRLLLATLSQSHSTRLLLSLLSLSQTLLGYYSLFSLSQTLIGYYSLLSDTL